jgi:hypothetical protein
VAVHVHRERDAAMAQALTDDLRMDVALEHDRRVAMPQLVEADARQFGRGEEPIPRMADRVGLLWLMATALELLRPLATCFDDRAFRFVIVFGELGRTKWCVCF